MSSNTPAILVSETRTYEEYITRLSKFELDLWDEVLGADTKSSPQYEGQKKNFLWAHACCAPYGPCPNLRAALYVSDPNEAGL